MWSDPAALARGIARFIEVQPGTSVLELGNAPLLQVNELIPEGVFLHHGHVDFAREPMTKYGLVLVQPGPGQMSVALPCIETQPGPLLDLPRATVEWGAKCCSTGGILLAVLPPKHEDASVLPWLRKHGTVLVRAQLPTKETLLVYRHNVKLKDHTLEHTVFDDNYTLDEWFRTLPIYKTGVCSGDPGPMGLKTWDIALVDNPEAGRYARPGDLDATVLYKAKHAVGIRWAGIAPAFEWAQGLALAQPPAPSWNQAVDRFQQRMHLDTFMTLEATPPDILGVPDDYPVVLDPALATYLGRRRRAFARMQTPYPEKSTLENRYFTLGPGSKLTRNGEVWKVNFSEPDFGSHKPPRLHIERVI